MSELKWGERVQQNLKISYAQSMATPSQYAASTWRMAGNGVCP